MCCQINYFLQKKNKKSRTFFILFLVFFQQEIVAGFVIFEPNEDPATTSDGGDPASSSAQTSGQNHFSEDDQDLEGQIMALDERWIVLCSWNEKRRMKLREVLNLWKSFEEERLRLSRWFDTAEDAFRVMERSPTEETNELLLQATEITVREIHGNIFLIGFFFRF